MENVKSQPVSQPADQIKSIINPVREEIKLGDQVQYLNGIAFVKDYFVAGNQTRANLKVELNERPGSIEDVDVPAFWLRLVK